MKLKKIYLEITNACNLNCSFCIKNNRPITYIDSNKFKYIINKIKNNTKEIYFHVLGEPLLHKEINNYIDYASSQELLVNITTNGYLINNLESKNIHRLNISLHSFNQKYHISLSNYLDNIFNKIDNIRDKTFISLRLWVNNDYNNEIIEYINKRYHTSISIGNKVKITNNLIIDNFHEFIWPDLNNQYYNTTGYCRGLIDHIGILSDGTIIPCCLDTKGIIKLGNIYDTNIDDIFNNERVKKMIEGFKKNYKYEELCRHCSFLEVCNNESIKLETSNK